MKTYIVARRTFEAAKYPKGSYERNKLNLSSLTSEYFTSYKYILLVNGENTTTPWTYRTKQEAEEKVQKITDGDKLR